MMLLAGVCFFLAIAAGVYAALEEEIGWMAVALILSIVTVTIVASTLPPNTSDKGYNVWKSYTISGNDTTDVTWHVAEKK